MFGHASYINPPCWPQVPSPHLLSLTSSHPWLGRLYYPDSFISYHYPQKNHVCYIFIICICSVLPWLSLLFCKAKKAKQRQSKSFFFPFEKKLTLGKEIITKYNHLKMAEKYIGWKNVIGFCNDYNSFTYSASEEFVFDSYSSIFFHIKS